MLPTGLGTGNQSTDDEEEPEMKLRDFISECAVLTGSMDTFTKHLSM